MQQRPRQRSAVRQVNSRPRQLGTLATKHRRGPKLSHCIAFACLVAIALVPHRLFWAISSSTADPPAAHLRGKPIDDAPSTKRMIRSKSIPNEENAENNGESKSVPKVFIGIKTGEGLTGHRFTQVRRTWLQDATEEADRGHIDIKFFTPNADVARKDLPSDLMAEKKPLPGGGGHNGLTDAASLRSLFVSTNCTVKHDLLCGTSALFKYYLDRHGNGTYFCSFDDDQYVIVRNLLRVLDEYGTKEPWRGRNISLGKMPTLGKPTLLKPIPKPVSWLTGGAGYCLSRDLVERGRHLLTDLGTVWHGTGRRGYSDDCAVGYVITQKLDTEHIQDERFHSHLEFYLWERLPLKEVSSQVSFGFNTKLRDHKNPAQRPNAKKTMPNVPMRFSSEEDPMLFRSLRCFLIKEKTGHDGPGCSGANSSLLEQF